MNIKIQGQLVQDDGITYHIHINKPIYNTCVSINSLIIKNAIDNNRDLRISCFYIRKYVEEVVSPRDWIKRSKKFSKVYRFKDRPMVFYQGLINPPEEEESKVYQLQLI